jgi:hypothetical protein
MFVDSGGDVARVSDGQLEDEICLLAGHLSAALAHWLALDGGVRPAFGVGGVGVSLVRAVVGVALRHLAGPRASSFASRTPCGSCRRSPASSPPAA